MIEMGKNITMQGKYTTRDGRAVRILCVDGPNKFLPVVGFIEGCFAPLSWDAFGGACREGTPQESDLIPVPTKHEGWIVISDGYRPSTVNMISGDCCYPTKAEAEAVRHLSPFSANWIVAHVTWEE
jgi:hypothetical protein